MSVSIVRLYINNDVEVETKKNNRAEKCIKAKVKLNRPAPLVQRMVAPVEILDTDACASIWQSVVVQAFYDLISEAKDREQKLDRARAIAWFGLGEGRAGEQTDLETVCELAGLNIHEVLRLSRRAMRGDVVNGEKIISGFNFRRVRRNISSRKNKSSSV